MLKALVYAPVIPHHSHAPSCSCYYEHTYGVDCLCECHSFSAQFERFCLMAIGIIIAMLVLHFILRFIYNLVRS